MPTVSSARPVSPIRFRATLLPLNPFVDADAAFDLTIFTRRCSTSFRSGAVWGLPAELNPTVLEYNRELFDAAGVDYPEPGWSIGDFLDTAIALTAGDGEFKTYGFVPDAFELNTMLLMLERQGAQLVDESDEVPTMAFTDPSTVEALRWYAGLSSELGIKPALPPIRPIGRGRRHRFHRTRRHDRRRARRYVDDVRPAGGRIWSGQSRNDGYWRGVDATRARGRRWLHVGQRVLHQCGHAAASRLLGMDRSWNESPDGDWFAGRISGGRIGRIPQQSRCRTSRCLSGKLSATPKIRASSVFSPEKTTGWGRAFSGSDAPMRRSSTAS